MYIKIENNISVDSPIDQSELIRRFPNTSFVIPITPEDLEPFGYGVIQYTAKPIAPNLLQDYEGNTYQKDQNNGYWIQKWNIRNLSVEEIEIKKRQILASIVESTQLRLDAFAQTRNYSDIKSACTYVGCPVSKFDIEGTYCRDVKALTWAKLYKILDDVESESRPIPTTYSQIESELPVLHWPN